MKRISSNMTQNTGLYYPTDIALKLSDHCPNNCMGGKYCFAENTPQGKTWISRDKLSDILQQARDYGLVNMVYFSAEPFADFDLLLYTTKTAHDIGIKPRFLDTSGYRVGESISTAENHFRRLKDAGFDITVEDGYVGTQYNGVDVSVDQFHPIPAEQCANTILGALRVFGPTKYVCMRVTHPSEVYNDNKKKNRTIELLIESGEVIGADEINHEIIFRDGSAVHLMHMRMHDDGFARRLAKERPELFYRQKLTPKELRTYKDLREEIPLGNKCIIEPFHKLYIDPDGQTYPALSRLDCLSGGNVYEISVDQAIKNIDENPLIPILIGCGLHGLLQLIEIHTGKKASLVATGPSTIGLELLSNIELMESMKQAVKGIGIDGSIREKLIPALSEFRKILRLGNRSKEHQC